MPNLIKIADWAKSINISRQSAYDAVKRCDIPVIDGQVDSEYATMLYQRNTRGRANGKRDALSAGFSAAPGGAYPAAASSSYDSARARREAAEASISEMKLGEMNGKYLVKDDVASAIFKISRALRDGLTNCARRIGADVAALNSADDCEEVITREHRALLDSMRQALSAELELPVEDVAE
jgi:hypothetical protein